MAEVRVTVFYVGDGDSILIRFPDGQLGLVDSNTTSWASIPPALKVIQQSGNKLAFLCMTHPHADHYRGMRQILNSPDIEIGEFWHTMPDVSVVAKHALKSPATWGPYQELSRKIDEDYKDLARILEAASKRAKIKSLLPRRIGDFAHVRTIGGVEIWSLAPSAQATHDYTARLANALATNQKLKQDTANAISAVLLLRFGGQSILLGGDATTQSWLTVLERSHELEKLDLIRSSTLKVAHHGAKNSLCAGLLEALRASDPDVAIISAGSRLHPSPETVAALEGGQRRVHITGMGGDLFPKGTPSKEPLLQALDFLSEEAGGDSYLPLCGDITVTVDDSGKLTIECSSRPNCSKVS
jgi:beta-lactamase superfamily II metal-dependent hydrolase